MLAPGTTVFAQLPHEFSQRILHPAVVVQRDGDVVRVALEEDLGLSAEQDFLIYYEVDREFMQQPVRVIPAPTAEPDPGKSATDEEPAAAPAASEIRGDSGASSTGVSIMTFSGDQPGDDGAESGQEISLETTGLAVSAECRECYRVSTLTANLKASLDREDQCDLTDVSATGFSVISGAQHVVGNAVPAKLHFEGKEFAGRACIQSIKELVSGKTRYGLRSLDRRKGGGNLDRGQQCISTALQRQQLRRISGNGK